MLCEARKDAERTHAKERLSHIDRLLAGWRSYYQFQPEQEEGGTAESLSSRECNVLELIAQGQSNKDIARSLGIAPETVKSHVKNIFIKLSVDKRAHAVARAQTLGLVKGS
jgi:LuxR family maltose regulon positive regulatory protein